MIVLVLGIVFTLIGLVILIKPNLVDQMHLWFFWGINIVFLASLVYTILLNQVFFPSSPTSYPFTAPSTAIIQDITLLIFLLTSPILIIDFIYFSRQLIVETPSFRQISGSFTIAAFFFLLMIFAHIFTTVYDYIPEIGPLFRDQFWFVHLVVAIGIMVPILQLKSKMDLNLKPISKPLPKLSITIILLLILTLGLVITSPYPPLPEDKSSLKIITYNIRQGYSLSGVKNLDGQLAILKEVDADIIGLQESDSARISGGNCDPVRYFANHLHMHSYYGPKSVTGTFGIALLSKNPIKTARTFFMYSIGEQTACIHA
ncbi:MAG: hypothetical protein EAX86_06825 [Candidatus Heimdallarchaeota archaeon]|nr:hypothetical protein [Candidatus Heimdallarchaeota archaeon]